MSSLSEAQQWSQNQFFVKLKQESSIRPSVNGKNFFSERTLNEKADLWKVVDVQSLIASRSATLSKGSNELRKIFLITCEAPANISEAMKDFADDPSVEYIEYNHVYKTDFIPNDPHYIEQWGMKRIGMEKAWDITTGSSSVVVGVIDTGVDYNHEDLKTQLWVNKAEDINNDGRFEPWSVNEIRSGVSGDFDGIDNDGNGFVDDVIGYDFTDQVGFANAGGGDYNNPDPDPQDDFGHGTSVAGIIGAAMNNGVGVAGIAPGCRIMTLRAFDARGIGVESDVARAIAYAIEQRVTILNMSFGDKTFSRVLRDVIRYAYAAGVTMIASAGNSSSDEIHYPSGYDETISVGASGEGDGLASFSNYGESIDLVAPGIGIITTEKGNLYSSFNGTSASAPFVTGAVALIESLHPKFSPEELRGILVASADDIGKDGWDHLYGAGRLNVHKALQMDEPTIVHITNPKTDFAASASTIVITGTAASPVMKSFSLQYGFGVKPDKWIDIILPQSRQVVAETLAVWDVSSLKDSTYIIRLSAQSDKGITIEDRVTIGIDHTAPIFPGVGFIPALDEDGYGVAVGFITDEPTFGKVWYRQKGSSQAWQWVSAEGNTTNNLFVGTVHNFYLGKKYLQPGYEYEFYFSAVNKAGIESSANNKGSNFTAKIENPVASGGFQKKPYSLGPSRVFSTSSDFDNDSLREIITNDLANGSRLMIREFRNTSFIDVTPPNLMDRFPRAIGDANGNGKKELLTSFVRKGFLYEASTTNGFPQNVVWADSSSDKFWPCAIADVNDDANQEIIAITSDSTIGIFSMSASNQITQIASLRNPTSPPPNGRNVFGVPTVAIGDFNGNGRTEMLFGDEDGDFFIYETRGGGNFEVTWRSENDFEGGSDYVAAGDFDGDGKKEIAVGFRTADDDIIPFWYFAILKIDGQNKSQSLWEQAFSGVEKSGQFGVFARIQNSLTAGSVDGDAADELIITTFPELYVIDFDPLIREFSPIWYQPLVNTNASVIADFDRNGVNEIGFSTADSLVFFEREVAYKGPPVPLSIAVEYLDSKSIRVNWIPSGDAPAYHLYKGSSQTDLMVFGKFVSTSAVDFSLQEGKTYLFGVKAVDSSKAPPESPFLYTRIIYPHPSPVIDSARYVRNGQVEIFVSQDMGTEIPSINSFRLNSSLVPQSVVVLNRRTMLLTFNELSDGTYNIIAQDIRDAEGIPFTSLVPVEFEIRNTVEQSLYILRVVYIPDGKIDVYFNRDLDAATAENISNYSFKPYGRVTSAAVDAANRSLVRLTLSTDQLIGALGKEYILKVSNVKSANGIDLVAGAGSTAGVIINQENLENIFVYPNPYNESVGVDHLTFANLTSRATIRIYSLSGMFVKEIEELDGNGGTEWYLDDEKGNKIPTGIYIYYATGKNSQGTVVEGKTGKFAVVR